MLTQVLEIRMWIAFDKAVGIGQIKLGYLHNASDAKLPAKPGRR
jgi:hypothetical protein